MSLLKLLLGEDSILHGWDWIHGKLLIDAAKHLEIDAVSVELDSDGAILLHDRQLLNVVLLDELKKGPVSVELRHFELVLVPVLVEAGLHVALGHVKDGPVDAGACLANENAKRHVEVRRFVLSTLHAVSVERVLLQQFFQ